MKPIKIPGVGYGGMGSAAEVAYVTCKLEELVEQMEGLVPDFDEDDLPEVRRPWTVPLYHLDRAVASLRRLTDHVSRRGAVRGTRRRRA